MDKSIPPGPNTTIAPSYLISCGVFAIISLALCILRIWSRMRPWPHLDDYMIAVAEILALAGYCLGIVASAHGWGHRSYYVSAADQTISFKCLFAMQLLWIHGVALIRISVACSLLRLSVTVGKLEKLWRWVLWILIATQIAIYIGFTILLFFDCRPLRGNWEPVKGMRCWDRHYTVTWGWVANSFNIGSDFILAMMPIQIIRTLNRPLREKILISSLMAMGLLATVVSAYKMTLSVTVFQGDMLKTTVTLSVWCKLEELIGVTAACMPSLKRPAEELLRRIGILSDRIRQSQMVPSFIVSGTDGWSWHPPGSQTTQVETRENRLSTSLRSEIHNSASTGDAWGRSSTEFSGTNSRHTEITDKG